MRRTLRVLIPIALTAGVVSGCAGSSSSANLGDRPFVNEQGKKAITVVVVDNNFEPAFVTVTAGTTVTFPNRGRNRHNVISAGDAFASSRTFESGKSVKITFTKTGDYPLYCSLHGTSTSGMNGGIRVVE